MLQPRLLHSSPLRMRWALPQGGSAQRQQCQLPRAPPRRSRSPRAWRRQHPCWPVPCADRVPRLQVASRRATCLGGRSPTLPASPAAASAAPLASAAAPRRASSASPPGAAAALAPPRASACPPRSASAAPRAPAAPPAASSAPRAGAAAARAPRPCAAGPPPPCAWRWPAPGASYRRTWRARALRAASSSRPAAPRPQRCPW
mmetsp:Transcript_68918/g.201781  ORF Transcript_68918/g.201781 Transcript_68918/m.201781 type:complete len:203 (+) Transcript_68918:410-1018(+)